MSVHLANLRVTRLDSANESATAHTGERYLQGYDSTIALGIDF